MTHAASDLYLGMVKDGKFIATRSCSKETEAAILECCAKPDEAAGAYGRLTGRCAVCSRPLTEKDSVARAVGPICLEKMGWA